MATDNPSKPQVFGTLPDGQEVRLVTLSSDALTVSVMTYGASVQDLLFEGAPMVLGSDRLADYLDPLIYCGAIVGRVANRISGGTFPWNGGMRDVDTNEAGVTCLHGGGAGTGQLNWQIAEHSGSQCTFSLTLADGHMGFPGALTLRATYRVTGATLRLELTAIAESDTVLAPAPHCYFNLAGGGSIDDHTLWAAADRYTEVDARLWPTGRSPAVDGTRFDFRTAVPLGAEGIDHNLCVSEARTEMKKMAVLTHPGSGRRMTLRSTEPGLQVYNAEHMGDAPVDGSHGRRFGRRAGVAMEPQVWPDAVNRPEFPSAFLGAGERFEAVSEFEFDLLE